MNCFSDGFIKPIPDKGGGGKYKAGSTLSMTDTVEKTAITKIVGCFPASDFIILGEDNTFVYLRTYDNSYYLITAYNKNTDTAKTILTLSTYDIRGFASDDNGYIYIGYAASLVKYNNLTGAIIWTCSLSSSGLNTGSVITMDGNNVYIFTSQVTAVKITVNQTTGVLVGTTSLVAYTCQKIVQVGASIYLVANNTVYCFDAFSGTQLSSTSFLATSLLGSGYNQIDYINKIVYVPTVTTVKAYSFLNTLLWTYTTTSAVDSAYLRIFPTNKGVYVYYSYNSADVLLNSNGVVICTNRQGLNSRITNLYYNYTKGTLWGSGFSANASFSCCPLEQIIFDVTIS